MARIGVQHFPSLAFLLLLSSSVGASNGGEYEPTPPKDPVTVEFSEVIFDDVTELELLTNLVGANFTLVDPISGLSGLLNYLWYLADQDLPYRARRPCLEDMWTMVTDMLQLKEYALQMRASNGRPPRLSTIAFTHGTTYFANFELCWLVKANDDLGVPMTAHVCDMTAPPHNINVGNCAPASCDPVDLGVIVNTVLTLYETIWHNVYFTCVSKSPWRWDSIFVICILSTFTVAAIIGTVYDLALSRRERNTQVDETPSILAPLQDTNIDYESHADEQTDKPPQAATRNPPSYETTVPPTPVDSQGVQSVENAQSAHSGNAQSRGAVDNKKVKKILLSFSILVNGAGVLSAKKSSGNLGALNGMRVLSMWWIVWYHSVYIFFGVVTDRIDNPSLFYEELASRAWFAATWEAHFGVDTFFVLSALLVTYLLLEKLDKLPEQNFLQKTKFWSLFYVHRYIRLTPVYMVCLGIWTSLLLPIGMGSRKNEIFTGSREVCKAYWWTNLFYINNLVPFPGSVNMCMAWTWYLANDMQFFIIAPIFIILIFKPKTRKIGLIALAVITAFSCIITAAVSGYWGYPVGNYQKNYNNRTDAFAPDADRNYAKPWCRIQAYTVGIFVGYLIYHFKGKKVKIHLIWNLIGWTLALGVMATVVFAMEATNTTDPLPEWFAATWHGVRRFLFAAAVGWVAFACVTGNGGPIDVFLSWSAWLPMAKLNYCVYLLHPVVIFHFLTTKKVLIHYTMYEGFFYFCGCLVTTYLLSLFISILVEVPISTLEKTLLPRK